MFLSVLSLIAMALGLSGFYIRKGPIGPGSGVYAHLPPFYFRPHIAWSALI